MSPLTNVLLGCIGTVLLLEAMARHSLPWFCMGFLQFWVIWRENRDWVITDEEEDDPDDPPNAAA